VSLAPAQAGESAHASRRHRGCYSRRIVSLDLRLDLELEVLRAAHELRPAADQPVTGDALHAHIAAAPQRFPRLVHPLLAHLIGPLADLLVRNGLLARDGAGYLVTDAGRAQLQPAPRYLQGPGMLPSVPRMSANLGIASFRWGQIVDTGGRVFKDARLYPGGIAEWDWGKTGTRHDPGIQIADLEDLVATRPDVIILSRGVDLVLQVPSATIDFALGHAPTVLVLQSEQAVAAYNERIAGERVVALVHSTC
jgi:hypothetical protein